MFIRDPSVRRAATAVEPGTTVLAIGGKPGSHEISTWEYSFAAYGLLAADQVERGLATLREGLDAKGEDARLLYDMACLESRSGRRDQALEHLQRAVELDPRYAGYAADDPTSTRSGTSPGSRPRRARRPRVARPGLADAGLR